MAGARPQLSPTPLGRALELANVPYYGPLAWVQFDDDLVALSVRYPGLMIVFDHADILLRERPHDMFELIEWYLHQFYHLYDKKKPCHLCFKMEQNDSVRRLFVREPKAVNQRLLYEDIIKISQYFA
jgi:hypothetical protein